MTDSAHDHDAWDAWPRLSRRGARACGTAHAHRGHRDRGLHGGRDRRGSVVRLDGAAGGRRAYGDPCRRRWGSRPVPISWRGGMRRTHASPSAPASSATSRLSPARSCSALLALGVVVESIHRLIDPVSVSYTEALPIAGIGLAVNIISALILQTPHSHDHGGHHHHHHDHNLRAAYVHVLADAATSVARDPGPGRRVDLGLALPRSGGRHHRRLRDRLLGLWADPRQRVGAAGRGGRSAIRAWRARSAP